MKPEYRILKITVYKGGYVYIIQEHLYRGGFALWRDALPEPFGTRKQAENALQELLGTTEGDI